MVSWEEPSATDSSGNPQRIRSHSPGTRFPIGETTVRYTFTDTSGNSATCTFTITVRETIPPIISGCPTDINAKTELGTSEVSVTWVEPTATDNYDTPQRTARTHAPGTLFPIGETTVVYIYTDSFNNHETCTFTVAVEVGKLLSLKSVISGS